MLTSDFIIKRPITIEMLDKLYLYVKFCRLSHCETFLRQMGMEQLSFDDCSLGTMTITDIIEQTGVDEVAEYVGPVYFYGGPQTTGVQTFHRIRGNILQFVMDAILYEYVNVDKNVFEKLGIDLC